MTGLFICTTTPPCPRTKVAYSIYFVLAEWLDATSIELVFPDGFSVYHLRSTSKKTIENLRTALKNVTNMSGGHWAGVPFDIRLVNHQGFDSNGNKRSYPVFAFLMKPRGGLRLSSQNFRAALMSGNQAAKALQLPTIPDESPQDTVGLKNAPEPGTFTVETGEETEPEAAPSAEAEAEPIDAEFVPVADIDEAKLRNLAQNKDPEAMKRQWFALVRGTPLEEGEARADFLARHVDGITSLSEVVGILRPKQYSELLTVAKEETGERTRQAASSSKLEKTVWHDSVTPTAARLFLQAIKEAEINRIELFPMLQLLTGRKQIDGSADIHISDIERLLDAFGTFDDDGNWWLDLEKKEATWERFRAWVDGPDSALGVLS